MRRHFNRCMVIVLLMVIIFMLFNSCDELPLKMQINILSGREMIWKEPITITAETDRVTNARFGYSVSITDNFAIVGAPGENSNTGAAYIFTRNGSAWSKLKRITPTSPVAGSRFGASVGISGSYAIVGSPDNFSAYIFYEDQGSTDNWGQVLQLTGNVASRFGYAVSINGFHALVGAYQDNGSLGRAYIFFKDHLGAMNSWGQCSTILDTAGVAGDFLGTSVCLSGSYAVAGAPDGNGTRGLAIIFTKSNDDYWIYSQTITASDGVPGDEFGRSVAITELPKILYLFIGDPVKQTAYEYYLNLNTWTEGQKLSLTPKISGSNYSCSTTVYGNYIILGSSDQDSVQGAAYGYDINTGIWDASVNNPLIKPLSRVNNDNFAWSASIYDQYAIISSWGDSTYANQAGSAYIYHLGYFDN